MLRATYIVAASLLIASLWATELTAARLEAGTFTSHDTISGSRAPATVNFQQPFDVPPIVVAIASTQGNNSSTIRITNVTTTGFDELAIEPDNWDGRHIPMTIQYIALEPGRHTLPDGTVIEAGFVTTSATQFGSGFTGGIASWQTVNFSGSIGPGATVLHQILTANSETNNPANGPSRPHITSIVQSISGAGFQIALERSQANSGPFPSAETIGWIAFPAGASGTLTDIASNTVTWSSVNTGANVRGWDDGCFSNSLGQTSTTVVAVAKKISRNNPDGGWFRYCALNSSNITLRVDEDRDQDNERSVPVASAEQASILSFSRPFHAVLLRLVDLAITKTNTPGTNGEVDQANDTVTFGATTTYTLTVTNNGPLSVNGALVSDVPGAGLTCPPANPVTITGAGQPSGSFTIADLTGSGIALGNLLVGESTTLTYSCTVG